MGLDTTHGAWNGPCNYFNCFRRWLANQIGIDLYDYIGFGKFVKTEGGIEYVETGFNDLKSIKHDIQPLLDHSDCDGLLTPEECQRVANGLKDIIDRTQGDPSIEAREYRLLAIRFKNGCLLAAKKKENLEFH